ncbi:heme biosynthesis HemY N-terminal domain-containing protein [Roseibium salinum]|nr:heme biosynthesis HemY N-terminal domain-containing protein [Roseibium salinum]
MLGSQPDDPRPYLFFALLFALASGFAWMADLPGTISITWNGYVWEQPPVIVALVAGVLLAAFLAVVWIIRVILKSPQIASRFLRRRRKDKGYAALSQGLIAIGTGNAKLARRHGLEADRLLSDEPATKLLLAQTAQLAGRGRGGAQPFRGHAGGSRDEGPGPARPLRGSRTPQRARGRPPLCGRSGKDNAGPRVGRESRSRLSGRRPSLGSGAQDA